MFLVLADHDQSGEVAATVVAAFSTEEEHGGHEQAENMVRLVYQFYATKMEDPIVVTVETVEDIDDPCLLALAMEDNCAERVLGDLMQ